MQATNGLPLFDFNAVSEMHSMICGPDSVVEVRILDATIAEDNWPRNYFGYFNDADKMVAALRTVRSHKGCYFVLNPVLPQLLARSANRIKRAGKGDATTDLQIVRRAWLPIDCDAVRPAGISSSDQEHKAAINRAEEIVAFLREHGWPEPTIASSGNGAHLLYPIDLPVDDGGLVKRVLEAIAQQFPNDGTEIDTKVFNPSRLWKMYGSLVCKGDSIQERPHRMARVIAWGTAGVVVTRDQLEALVKTLQPAPSSNGASSSPSSRSNGKALAPFDLESFIQRHGLDVDGPHPWQTRDGSGKKWTLNTSPLCDHGGDGPFIGQMGGGAITAGCHHNSCSWAWEDLRERFEPRNVPNVRKRVDECRDGRAVEKISNYDRTEARDETGKLTAVREARSMDTIIGDVVSCTGGWPRRVDNVLFVDDPEHGIDMFDRNGVASLFGWLRRKVDVDWIKGPTFVAQAELFAELGRTSTRYDSLAILPHEPPIENIYYQGRAPSPGDGKYLRQLVDRFRPETTIDRDLIQAAFMTPFWGGPAGSRPAIVITSDAGRGVGKTKLAEMIAHLAGGYVDVSLGEDIQTLKTRLLSAVAATKRVCVLDNVKSMKVSWAQLESLITAPVVSGKRNYCGEGQLPNFFVWLVTLNGVSLATDMAQRSVIIKLVRGENSDSWYEETRDFIDRHRSELIADVIGALRSDRFALPKYSRWASWERDVLCRLPEPAEAQRVILERQGAANAEHDEAEIIQDYFASQLYALGYNPVRDQVRIPVEIVARWYCRATNDKVKTQTVSKHLSQMAEEGQLPRLAKDPGRAYGRCFIWTGAQADTLQDEIRNNLQERIADASQLT